MRHSAFSHGRYRFLILCSYYLNSLFLEGGLKKHQASTPLPGVLVSNAAFGVFL